MIPIKSNDRTETIYQCKRAYSIYYAPDRRIALTTGIAPKHSIICVIGIGEERKTRDDDYREYWGAHGCWEWISGALDSTTLRERKMSK